MALLALVLALAGLRRPDASSRIETEGIAILVLVDVSKSMDKDDFEWQGRKISRLEAVKRVVRLFIKGNERGEGSSDPVVDAFAGRPNDLIGMITFAHRPETICPLTLSHSVLLGMLDAEQVRSTPDEAETNLSDPVASGGPQQLRDAGPQRKIIVLLTDGEHNVEPTASGWSPREARPVAGSIGIPIYTLDAGVPANKDAKDDERAGAIQPGRHGGDQQGNIPRTRDTAALIAAWQDIDRLERNEIQSFLYRRYYEAYPWFGLASFVFYATSLVLGMTWWRRLP